MLIEKIRNASQLNKAIAVAVGISVGVVGYTLIVSNAAGPYAASEAESGTLVGAASVIDDASASAGKAIKFGAQPPTSTGGWPTAPPAQICGNNSILGAGPASAPAGAITVPVGNNSGIDFSQDGKTYWFAPGVHTLGTGAYSQIMPGDNSTFVGAPGAVIDGQNKNLYAFTGQATNVKIQYLTIKNFGTGLSNNNEGTVNHDSGDNWLVEYTTITNVDGAALMMGNNNTYRYNCLKDNGQYAINAYRCRDYDNYPKQCGGSVLNPVVDHNEISGNNVDDWEARIEGCGCTGGIKFWDAKDGKVTNNYVHHNKSVGVWFDNSNRGFLIEGNYIDGNDSQALFLEAGYDAKIVSNTIKNNTWKEGRSFVGDSFALGTVYISENGSDPNLSPRYYPMSISNNYFENNWGGVVLWENSDRFCGSPANTHGDYCTQYFGGGYDPAPCSQANIGQLADKYKCRWSTQNVLVENNEFRIDKNVIGTGCAGANWCGLSGIFSNYGTYPDWSPFKAWTIPDRITFSQNNVFRNNKYYGDWKFKLRDQGSNVVDWNAWRGAPYNQDAGSTKL
jgi:hypothetical protein